MRRLDLHCCPFGICWLIGVALFCSHYHDGQWSRFYRLGCIARERLRREYQITDVDRWLWDNDAIDCKYQIRAKMIYDKLVQQWDRGELYQ